MSVAEARSRVAVEVKRSKSRGGDQPERIRRARADLAKAKLEQYIQRVLQDAPPLTAEQLARLAVLLQGGTAPQVSE